MVRCIKDSHYNNSCQLGKIISTTKFLVNIIQPH